MSLGDHQKRADSWEVSKIPIQASGEHIKNELLEMVSFQVHTTQVTIILLHGKSNFWIKLLNILKKMSWSLILSWSSIQTVHLLLGIFFYYSWEYKEWEMVFHVNKYLYTYLFKFKVLKP